MKRYHDARDQRIINRNFKERQRMSKDRSVKFNIQRGRYRKKDAYDCGNVGCMICFWKRREAQSEGDASRNALLKRHMMPYSPSIAIGTVVSFFYVHR